MEEIYKDIKGYEGLYQVSNKGNVRRLVFINNQTMFPKITNVKGTDNCNGYLYVKLSKNGNKKNYYIHRLVAETFIPMEKNKKSVNHLDYNKHNNCVENLEWCTQLENVNYSIERMKHARRKARKTNTGEKYISKRKNGIYRVVLRGCINCDKSFKDLEKAIIWRNNVLAECGELGWLQEKR